MESANYSEIRLHCPARWTVRAKALHSIHNNHKAIHEWLTWRDSMMLLDHTDHLSATLQTTNLCVADA